MSRRQSRTSTDVRHNDTLLEFETFKKKFLLTNRHIAKLNSTLSVRIEELNAQISTLYVENLRLRSSEIALATQLKKEKEKSRRVMADTEAAIHNFVKHLGYIRKSHNIPHGRSITPEAHPPPRARRLLPNPNTTPPVNKIARPPNVPNIREDDEANMSSPEAPNAEADEDEVIEFISPTPLRRKSKPRSSASKLPLPTRTSSPPPPPPPPLETPFIDLDEQRNIPGKRKPTRRQSGLLTTSMSITTVTEPPRPPSPAFGSPLRREVALEEEEEVIAVISGFDGREDEEPELIAQSIMRREKRTKVKEREVAVELERGSSSENAKKEREKKRLRDLEDQPGAAEKNRKFKLRDVTNSPPLLPPLDTALSDRDRRSTPDDDIPPSATSTTTTTSIATSRAFLTTPAATPAPSLKGEPLQLPTPRGSSPIPPQPTSDSEQQAGGGRERRTRKSVNYAEPKLNTKMRKPEGYAPTIKRYSKSDAHSAPRPSGELPAAPPNVAEDLPPPPVVRRKRSPSYILVEEDDESEGAQADEEYGSGTNADGRRRSTQASGGRTKMLEGDDGRRHSMAV